MTHVVVVGGGITGLAAAWYLRGRADVTVIEATPCWGGKIETVEFAGRRVDTGPDAFIARVPDGTRMCTEVGLAGDLVSPATGQASVWTRDGLRPLPEGLVLGVPSALRPLVASGVVPPAGVARAALDLVMPRTRIGDDISVGDLVRRRMGRHVHEQLVDPLLGGINAGRTEELSIEAGAPQLAALARHHRSLVRGARATRAAASTVGPAEAVFHTVRGGLGRLVGSLTASLTDAGAQLRAATAVAAIEPASGGYLVHIDGGSDVAADGVVIAVPGHALRPLLADVAPDAAAASSRIDYSSVVLALLAYPADAFPRPFTGSGYLVPRVAGRLTTAVSWASAKWAHLAGDDVILRVSAGRWNDERALHLDDTEVLGRMHAELVEATGLRASAPAAAHVRRWPRGFPQYRVGHLGLIAYLESCLRDAAPAIEIAGAAYRGLGIPACIAQGRAAADRVVAATQG